MAFNPLQSYLSGQQAGQMQQSNTLAGNVANQMQNPEFNARNSTDFRQLQALDPDRANKQMEMFQNLSKERKKAYFDDMVIGKSLLEAGDMSGFGSFIDDRLTNLKRLGSEDTSGTEMIQQRFNEGDVQGIMQGYDAGIKAGQQLGFLGEGGNNKQFAPETSAPKVDPTTGQIFYTVFDKNTREATRVDIPGAMAQTPGEIQSGVVSVDTQKQLAKQAIEASTKAFEQLPQIKKSIGNIDSAINAINSGANTGKIAQYLPSITEASLNLDNIAGQMGLDVISSVTFGALSESELKFAVDTALPRGLEGPALKDWLGRKKTSQQKLARELQKMAIFLGKGGKGRTVADYLSQDSVNYSQSLQEDEKSIGARYGVEL
jgi:hypothetical protein